MFGLLKARFLMGKRTLDVPTGVRLAATYRGRPELGSPSCPEECRACAEACPTGAIATGPLRIDLARCVFCPVCQEACEQGAIRFTPDHRLAASRREDLVLSAAGAPLASALEARARRLLKRSLKLRQVSAGGCNGCEAELNASGNIDYDLGRFGVQFVASPRHADGVVITGPVTENMREALLETYRAVPSPRLVIAVGACALSGGVFAGLPAAGTGVPAELSVDLFVPGCPPHPFTFIDGILRLLGRTPRG